jgi:hypothetical protein
MSIYQTVMASKNTTIRVSLTTAERRELRIAAAKADVSVSVLVRRLAMAALRQGLPMNKAA